MRIQNKDHSTPLHVALMYGSVDIALLLLDHGAATNSKNDFGRTPLHLVAKSTNILEQDCIRIARLLLERGADVNAQDRNTATPLHMASYYGRAALARVLLDGGAAVNSKGNQGRTPLHSAAEGIYLYSEDDGIRVSQVLLERGADVNAPDEDNRTPLHLISHYGRVEIARLLLDRGANTNSRSNQGRTPLHSAAEGIYLYSEDDGVRVAQLLLERGADVNVSDEENRTPLHLVSFYGRVEIARVLLDGGAATNSKSNQGQTPLHVVAGGGGQHSRDNDVLFAQLLLERGADVNAQDDDNETPLHLASSYGCVEMILVLLNAGGNPNTKNAWGQTPLHLVSQYPYCPHDEIVCVALLLLKHGADVMAEDNNGATPSDLASMHGRMEIASSLPHYSEQNNAILDECPTPRQMEGGVQLHDKNCPPLASTDGISATSTYTAIGTWVRERRLHPRLPRLPFRCSILPVAKVLVGQPA